MTEALAHAGSFREPANIGDYRRPAGRSRLRITRRGRAVLTALVATPFVVVALMVSLNGGGATATSAGGAPLESVTVHSGESLWQVAQQVAPNSDPREVIADIVRVNRLESAEIHPGQRLDIPAEYTQAAPTDSTSADSAASR